MLAEENIPSRVLLLCTHEIVAINVDSISFIRRMCAIEYVLSDNLHQEFMWASVALSFSSVIDIIGYTRQGHQKTVLRGRGAEKILSRVMKRLRIQ